MSYYLNKARYIKYKVLFFSIVLANSQNIFSQSIQASSLISRISCQEKGCLEELLNEEEYSLSDPSEPCGFFYTSNKPIALCYSTDKSQIEDNHTGITITQCPNSQSIIIHTCSSDYVSDFLGEIERTGFISQNVDSGRNSNFQKTIYTSPNLSNVRILITKRTLTNNDSFSWEYFDLETEYIFGENQ